MNTHNALKLMKSESLSPGVSNYRCSYCPNLLPSLIALRRHYQNVHKEEHDHWKAQRYNRALKKKFKRKNVDNSAKNNESLPIPYSLKKKHESNNDNSNIPVIEKRNSTGNIHDSAKKARMSVDATEFPCKFCAEMFASLSALTDHIRNEHKNEDDMEPRPSYDKSNIAVTKDNNSRSGMEDPKKIPLYQCTSCKYTSISYDHMIEHCQDHLIKTEDSGDTQVTTTTRKCEPNLMELDVDDDTYNVLENNLNINSYNFIDCDYKLLKTDDWPANYDKLKKSEIDSIKCCSIYYFTRIIRLTSPKKVSSAPYMIFECQKCMKYVDPYSIVSHVEDSSCNQQLKGYPCYVCNLPFLTETSMYLHYKTHQVANVEKKYRIIKFNDNDEENAVLLRAAGRRMKCASSGYNLVQKKSDIAKTQADIQNVLQQKTDVALPNDGDKNCRQAKDDRTMKITGAKTEIKNNSKESCEKGNNVAKEEKSVTIYKCQCELSFHSLNELFKHIETCPSDVIINKKTCVCSLIFDKREYDSHCKIHSQGITKFIIKKVTVSEESVIALDLQHNYKKYANEKENVVKGVSNDNALHTDKSNSTATNVVKLDQEKTHEKSVSKDLSKEAISELMSSILNLPNVVRRTGDPKTVEEKRKPTVAANIKADNSTDKTAVKCNRLTMTVAQLGNESKEIVTRTEQDETPQKITSQSECVLSHETLVTKQQQTDVNKATELVIDTPKETNNENKSLHPKLESNHSLIEKTVDVELTGKETIVKAIVGNLDNVSTSIPEVEKINLNNMESNEIIHKNSDKEITQQINNDQMNEPINEDSNKNIECRQASTEKTNLNNLENNDENSDKEITLKEKPINEDSNKNIECRQASTENVLTDNQTNPECSKGKDPIDNKVYTEEELLNETDDEHDPRRLYDHADEDINKDTTVVEM